MLAAWWCPQLLPRGGAERAGNLLIEPPLCDARVRQAQVCRRRRAAVRQPVDMASVGASLSGNFHQTQGQRLLDIAAPAALVEQLAGALATAGRATPLANEGDWLGMTA